MLMKHERRTRVVARLAALLASALLAAPAGAATVLSDTKISLSAYEGAVCNNGEPADMQVTTVADGDGVSTKWFVHFEGGGSCKDDTSCQERWANTNDRKKMQPSAGYPQDGMPNLTKDNNSPFPFDGYNTVQLHYCSSDGWIGAKSGELDVNGDPVVYNGTDILVVDADSAVSGEYGIHFRGKRIVQAALDEIERLYNVSTTATDIVVAGKSAGSLAVQAHIDKVAATLGGTGDVRGLMIDTWVPFLPLLVLEDESSAEAETRIRNDLSTLGISAETVDDLLEFALFDADDNLLETFNTADVWGALNNVATEGWPGPEACFDAISTLPSVIANPHHLMLCSVHDFVLNPAYNDGVTPYIANDMLILRNFYDVAVSSAAYRLFPDHDGITSAESEARILSMMGLQNLSQLKNYLDGELRSNLFVDASTEMALAFYSVILPLTQTSLEGAAAAANVTVFSPGLEMTTDNCNLFNWGACSFPEPKRRGLPTHGIVDLYLSQGFCTGNNTNTLHCPDTYNGHVIQPFNSSALGKARTIRQFLNGWASGDSDYDYSLVGDVKIP